MKRICYTLLLALLWSSLLFSQGEKQVQKALNHLEKKSIQSGQLDMNLKSAIVTDQYTSAGVTHIYFQQSYEGIEIAGTNAAVHSKNNQVVTSNNQFLTELSAKSAQKSASLTAKQAVLSVAEEKGYPIKPEKLKLIETKAAEKNQSSRLTDAGISKQEIPARLVYFPTPEGSLRLTWEIEIYEKNSDDYMVYRVDASTGKILDEHNRTIYCNFGDGGHAHTDHSAHACSDESHLKSASAPNAYNVFPMPVVNPYEGTRSIVTAPWLDNPVASPDGWHSALGVDTTITMGNNLDVYKYIPDSENDTIYYYNTDGGANLEFDFPLDLDQAYDQYLDAAITNVFYWGNVTHDVWYNYGFDEPSGNFQMDNFGRGGEGNDRVEMRPHSDGQCNAWMITNPDGQVSFSNIFSCQGQDIAYDNIVTVHEYGHGISIRLTGGPASVYCLRNSEQMGEGWSDWFGLMMTMNPGDQATDARDVGEWLRGGEGIRDYPYSTDMSVNPLTYSDVPSVRVPHGVGTVWATMLWDMTWGLIDQHGFDPDVYNGTGGNNIAMALVIEALKLQPCSPGFVDGRDAILAADQLLYGGANQCIIWEAFTRRGLGYSANQNNTDSTSDGIPAFNYPPACAVQAEKTANAAEVQPGENITYTITVTNTTPDPVSNITITDTIPANTAYVSGGTLNGSVVTFPSFSLAVGAVQSVSFTVQVDPNIAPVSDFFDDAENGPDKWNNIDVWEQYGYIGSWEVRDSIYFGGGSHAWIVRGDEINYSRLELKEPVEVSPASVLTFTHFYNSGPYLEGGLISTSTDGGQTWTWVEEDYFIQNGYSGYIGNPLFGNAISAFNGNPTGPVTSKLDLSAFANESVLIRFNYYNRYGTGAGWAIDNIHISNLEPLIQNTALINDGSRIQSARLSPATVVNIPNSPLNLNLAPSNVSCPGDSDGYIEALADGGSGNYTYNWSTGAQTNRIENLAPGTYSVTVSDGAQTAQASVTILDATPVNVTTTSTAAVYGDDGTVTASVTGGSPPYVYQWNVEDQVAVGTGIEDLVPGTYEVTVTDAKGCPSITAIGVVADSLVAWCNSSANVTADESIGFVSIGDIQNQSLSPGTGYTDYTYLSTTLYIGNTVEFYCEPLFPDIPYNEGWKIWIDFNNDFTFDNETELLYTSPEIGEDPISGTFTIPADIVPGTARMRISMRFEGYPDPCLEFSHGEVEDYTVNLAYLDCTAGAPCDDYDECTVGDTYDQNCNCISGTLPDADNDGVCDAQDICPGGDDNADADGDGIPDQCDTDCVECYVINTFPHIESFENGTGFICQDSDDDFDWQINSGNTPTSYTGPSYTDFGSNYFYTEATGNFPDKTATFESTCYHLTNVNTANLDFWYHMRDGADTMGTLSLDISSDSGNTWNNVWSKTAYSSYSWQNEIIDLNAYIGSTISYRFTGLTNSDQSDMALDEIKMNACVIGTPCSDNDPCTINEALDENCNCVGTFWDIDGDGVCSLSDCDDNDGNIGVSQAPGTICDDGDPSTKDDEIQADACTCAGEPDPCYLYGGDADEDGICANEDCDDNDPDAGSPQVPGTICDDGDPATIDDVIQEDGCTCMGSINNCIDSADADGDGICADVDCDDNDANISISGTSCDDGDPNTIQDTLNTNCNCAGTPITPCVNGLSGGYPCNDVDLVGFMSNSDMGCFEANDIWGWTDPLTGTEYAIFGCLDRTTFIDISTPTNPVLVGALLSTDQSASNWRDMKVYANHAYIVSEASGHGVQIFDLTRLRDVANPPVMFDADNTVTDLGNGVLLSNSHNIVINEQSGFAYTVGSNICSGGLTVMNLSNPKLPVFAGCFSADGYTHDAQCVDYVGPDGDYTGKEICFNSNENTLTIVDVTDKSDMVQISRTGYSGQRYTHQGWLTEDHQYFLMNDELDESNYGHNTRTYIWDVRDLDSPIFMGYYEAAVGSIDHNLYIKDDLAYMANYRSGLRIVDINDIANANLSEVAFFDTYPDNDSPYFTSAWSNYPYFESGYIIISDIEQGMFIVRHNPTDDCVNNGGDADGDGICADADCNDNDANVGGTGSTCDDGDACTTGDVLDANCNCTGTLADSDNDGVCDADDNCPNFDDNLIGTACDDGNACTTGDIWDTNCECTGTIADADNDGVCDADDNCPNFDDNLIGTTCDDGDACTTDDIYDINCNCAGTFADTDNDGICDSEDVCQGLDDTLIGTPCDDGDSNTTNDTWGTDCNCTGTPVVGCTITTTSGGSVQSSNGSQNCRTFDLGDEHQDISFALSGINSRVNGKPSSRYIDLVTVQYVDANGTTQTHATYTSNGTVYIAGPATSLIVCIQDNDGSLGASVIATVGTITSCVEGDTPPDCTVGATCDDGDACTTGDAYDANCDCAGTSADADGDGVCAANDPNDNDPCIPNACGDCTTYNSESFEGNWGIWNDGGNDVGSDAVYANTGTYCVRLRDNSGQASSIYTDILNLSAYSSLDISFSFFASSMETGEDFYLEMSTNGGSSYTTVQRWVSGTDFINGTRYNETVSVSGFNSSTVFRIRCDASANNDRVYIDDVVIEDCSAAGKLETEIGTVNIFPNPSHNYINVDLSQIIQTLETDNIEVLIFSLDGKRVYQNEMQVTDILHLNIEALSSAQMYLLHLRTDDGRMFRGKFVKF